eukprot:1714404-Amphidinium_carterae.1
MSALEAGDETLLRAMQIRKAAQEAFHFVDASARVRRSILSGPRPVRHFDGHHRSKGWISFRGNLWLCAPEQVRDSTREEQLAHDRVTQDLLETARELRVEGIGYQDLSEARSSEPVTFARLARPYDATEDLPSDMQDEEVLAQMIPEVTEHVSRSSEQGSGAQRTHRSRSRGREEESLFCTSASGDDQVIQGYLDEYSALWGCSFEAVDLAEWCYMTGDGPLTKAEVKKRKEVNFHQLSRHDQLRYAEAMKTEWENILQPHAAQLLSLEDSKAIRMDPTACKRIIPTRWVLVEKDMGTGVESKAKAID